MPDMKSKQYIPRKMGIFYSPLTLMTEEMYLDELRDRKRRMLGSGDSVSTMASYLVT